MLTMCSSLDHSFIHHTIMKNDCAGSEWTFSCNIAYNSGFIKIILFLGMTWQPFWPKGNILRCKKKKPNLKGKKNTLHLLSTNLPGWVPTQLVKALISLNTTNAPVPPTSRCHSLLLSTCEGIHKSLCWHPKQG